jgi:hypothetical protein
MGHGRPSIAGRHRLSKGRVLKMMGVTRDEFWDWLDKNQ